MTLHAAAVGAGPAITFLHGFGLHGGTWAAQVAEFSRTHRAITIDLPGFGRSPDAGDMRPMPDLIARALDARGVRETALVGLSLGGAVATDFALAHPARVTALVLADALLLGYPATLETWDTCVALARAGDCAGAREHWLTDGVFAKARGRPAVWAAIRAMLDAYDCGHWMGAAALRWATTRPRERLSEIRVPTLVLVGEYDTPAFQAMADVYVAGIAGARKVVLPAAGHVSCMEEPAAFNEALRGFLASAGGGPRPPRS